jgi:UDP-2,3-diacylglucosamine pyrophosphatase LpxH
MKIYCASDFHIGYEHANYPKIIEFFDLVKDSADRLILCGDIFDLWRVNISDIKKKEPMKSSYDALLLLSKEVPITYLWGNHDYKVGKIAKELEKHMKITDDFISKNIYYCHGWRFDVQQRFAHILYGWLVKRFPQLYQMFFKKPYEIKKQEEKHDILTRKIHNEAKVFMKIKNAKYLIMGHTHDPVKEDKLFDCGDMIDSLSYVIIENGQPKLVKMSRD